jgi:CubicO group peptidase (beta-lactamase class C family)
MKRATALTAVTLIGSLSHSLPAVGQANVARMRQIVQSYVDAKQFMGTVLVVRGRQTLIDSGYGYANLEWQVSNTPETKFRLGSITKQFTAASILLLEERGKLRTEDLIKQHMPDAPAAWDHITIANVLNHTSGIPSFTEFADYPAHEVTTMTPKELVAWFRDKPLDFPAGEKWHYSNSGYALLGYIVEQASGQTYQEFLQQNLFTPLGMTSTGYDSHAEIIAHRATGYRPGPTGPTNASYIDMTVPFGAGGLYSTTHDLLQWERALFGGKVVSAASLAKMTTPVKENYAFGLVVATKNGQRVIEHGGGINGFNTALAYYPDDSMTVVVLGNLNGSAPDDIAAKLAAAAHGEQVVLASERRAITVSPTTLATYTGTYALSADFHLVITLENGQLMSQAGEQDKLPLFAESETRFFLKVVDAQIDFVKDDQGHVTHLVLHQGGRDTKGVRL